MSILLLQIWLFYMKAPNRLDFTLEEIDSLVCRLKNKSLEDGDYSLLTEILRAMVWLSFSLQEKELSIIRLRKIFGIKTESAKKLLQLVSEDSLQPTTSDKQSILENTTAIENNQNDRQITKSCES